MGRRSKRRLHKHISTIDGLINNYICVKTDNILEYYLIHFKTLVSTFTVAFAIIGSFISIQKYL